jgi:hypothetical protein
VQRLADLDNTEVVDAGMNLPLDLDLLAEGAAHVFDQWMTTARERTLARYACLLEATHHPELRGILAHGERPRAQARELLAALGAEDPERQSRDLVAFLDGLVFDRLVGPGALGASAPGTPESRAELASAIRTALRGVLGK